VLRKQKLSGEIFIYSLFPNVEGTTRLLLD